VDDQQLLLGHQKGRIVLMARQAQRGVTLIELMVGVAILGIALALGIPNFSSFLANSKVRNAAESIQNGLNLARAEAVNRNTQVQMALVGTDSSWQVGCVTSSTDCPDSIQSRTASEGSTGVSVTATDSTIAFDGYGRVATAFASGNSGTFDLSLPASGTCVTAGGKVRCLRVVVTSGGQVRMCDQALTASNPSDPQAC
jgi:type IV fimbrial biogenesis protein FimT